MLPITALSKPAILFIISVTWHGDVNHIVTTEFKSLSACTVAEQHIRSFTDANRYTQMTTFCAPKK